MPSTLFTDGVTLVQSSWLNAVDKVAFSTLSAVAGTNTITATGPTTLTAYASGDSFEFTPAATNTGATTINITSLGAKNVFQDGAACIGGELKINVPVRVKYDGTQFNIIGERSRGPVLLSTAVASNSATVDLTSTLTANFDELLITVSDFVAATDNVSLSFRVSEDSGATFKAGGTDYAYTFVNNFDAGATPGGGGSTGANAVNLSTNVSNAKALSGEVKIFAPGGTSRHKIIRADLALELSGGTILMTAVGGVFKLDTNAINGFRFITSAGNITAGNFALYGIRKS